MGVTRTPAPDAMTDLTDVGRAAMRSAAHRSAERRRLEEDARPGSECGAPVGENVLVPQSRRSAADVMTARHEEERR